MKTYTLEQAARDLNPTPEARFTMYHWSADYASKGLGAMGYWDNLPKREKDYYRAAVKAILAAERGKRK